MPLSIALPSASEKSVYSAVRGRGALPPDKAWANGIRLLPDIRTMPTPPRPAAVATAAMVGALDGVMAVVRRVGKVGIIAGGCGQGSLKRENTVSGCLVQRVVVGWALVAHAFSGCLYTQNAWAASAHPTLKSHCCRQPSMRIGADRFGIGYREFHYNPPFPKQAA